ncbi:MAG: crotonase/enoyl-CoA hydratase family protein [Ilumatobacteraceae bacterium]
MSSGGVAVDRLDNGVVHVRLQRSDKRNALDAAMFRSVARAGARLLSDMTARAVVVSGDGESFCAGLDLSAFGALDSAARNALFDPLATSDESAGPATMMADGDEHLAQFVCRVWRRAPVPVVAAMHGHALGAGLQIALGADVRIAHPDTQVSFREVHWGIIPDMAGTWHAKGLVRDDVMRELVYSARIIDGHEAHRVGLVTHLADDPRTAALELAAEIAARSPDAVRAAKALFDDTAHGTAADHMARERTLIAALIGGSNQREAVMANLDKRPPRFVDPHG